MGIQTTTNINVSNNNNSQAAGLVSVSAFEELWPHHQQQRTAGLVVALWIQPPPIPKDDNDKAPQSLLALKRPQTESSSSLGLTPCDVNQVDLQLIHHYDQNQWVLDVWFRTSETVFAACHRLRLSANHNNNNNKMQHVALSLVNGLQQVYWNGQLQQESYEPFDNALSHWHAASRLSLMGVAKPNNSNNNNNGASSFVPWKGILYQLDLASGEASVSDLFYKGLVPAPPLVHNSSVTINEDAEPVAESHPPEWYSRSTNNIHAGTDMDMIPALELPVELVQSQAWSVMEEEQPHETTQQHQTLPPNPQDTVHRYITRLPQVGNLYRLRPGGGEPILLEPTNDDNDDDIEDTDELLWEIPSQDKLVYLPPPNAHSPITHSHLLSSSSLAEFQNDTQQWLLPLVTLEYCASLYPLWHAQECANRRATLSIIVRPVNDPPIPNFVVLNEEEEDSSEPATAVVVYEGFPMHNHHQRRNQRHCKILLTGSDVDVGDAIRRVQITVPPEHGELVLSVSTFRRDGLVDGTLLSELEDWRIRGRDPVYLRYRYTGGVVVRQTHSDQFAFRVADKAGRWSVEKTVPIEIRSALQVHDGNHTVVMNTASSSPSFTKDSVAPAPKELVLTLNDDSGYNRSLGLFVEPPDQGGVLVDPQTGQPISNGGTMVLVKSRTDGGTTGHVQIVLEPSPILCTNANQQDHVIRFRTKAVAMDATTGAIQSVSNRVVQHVHVHCLPTPLLWRLDSSLLTDEATTTSPPRQLFRVQQSDALVSSLDPCSGGRFFNRTTSRQESSSASSLSSLWQQRAVACQNRAILFQGLTVHSDTPLSWREPDEEVILEVSTGHGYVTWNPEAWHWTRPLWRGGRRIEVSGRMQVAVAPQHVDAVLAFLHYSSPTVGPDILELALFQGNCSLVLQHEEDHNGDNHTTSSDPAVPSSMTSNDASDCHVARLDIPIVVGAPQSESHHHVTIVWDDNHHGDTNSLGEWTVGVPWHVLLCMVGYPLIYIVWVTVEAWLCRSSANHPEPEDDNNNDDDEEDDDSGTVWIQYETQEGDYFYYQNTRTGQVTWMAPIDSTVIPWNQAEGVELHPGHHNDTEQPKDKMEDDGEEEI